MPARAADCRPPAARLREQKTAAGSVQRCLGTGRAAQETNRGSEPSHSKVPFQSGPGAAPKRPGSGRASTAPQPSSLQSTRALSSSTRPWQTPSQARPRRTSSRPSQAPSPPTSRENPARGAGESGARRWVPFGASRPRPYLDTRRRYRGRDGRRRAPSPEWRSPIARTHSLCN